MTITVLPGDCLDVLRTLADNSINSVVTDPPYLIEFMGRRWDSAEDGAALGVSPFAAWLAGFIAGEGCFRVQRHKEGKYYTCTFQIHLRADDGAVLRALCDKIGGRIVEGEARESPTGGKSAPDIRWLVETREKAAGRSPAFSTACPCSRRKAMTIVFGVGRFTSGPTPRRAIGGALPVMFPRWRGFYRDLQDVKRYDEDKVSLDFDPFVPPMQAFHYRWAKEMFRVLKPGGHLLSFAATRTYHRMVAGIEDAGFEVRDTIAWVTGQGFPKSVNLGDGLGTALKPAMELICMARKPLSEKGVAANVLRWGTGAINVDGCRVATDENLNGGAYSNGDKLASDASSYFTGTKAGDYKQPLGRWPANLIHDGSDEVLAAFPETTSGEFLPHHRATGASQIGTFDIRDRTGEVHPTYGDTGSAARFFKQVKQDELQPFEEVAVTWISELEPCQAVLRVATGQSLPRATVVSASSGGNGWSTFLSGNTITELFRKASSCIIRTATSSTTESRTWSLLTTCSHKRIHGGCEIRDGEWWKPCRKCGEFSRIDNYYARRDGISPWCKPCCIGNAIENKRKRKRNRAKPFCLPTEIHEQG